MSARYEGYAATVTVDWESGTLHGEIADIPDVVTFESSTVEGLHTAFVISVNDYLAMCAERGEEPARPARIGDLVAFTDNAGVKWQCAVVDLRPADAPGWAFVACLGNPLIVPVWLSALRVVQRDWWSQSIVAQPPRTERRPAPEGGL